MTRSGTGGEGEVSVAITGVGAYTPVGYSALQTFTSVHSGIAGFRAWPFLGAELGERRVSELPVASWIEGFTNKPWTSKAERMMKHALREALFDARVWEPEDLVRVHRRCSISAHLALPYENRSGVDPKEVAAFREAAAGIADLHGAEVGFFPTEHAGGIGALAEAASRLRSGQRDLCVVGGVDSLLEVQHLQWLMARGRLKTNQNPSGLIPGEGAAFVVLERLPDALERGVAVYALVDAIGCATERIPFDGQEPTRAEGLSRALRDALAGRASRGLCVADVFTDLNGERARFYEWALAETRCLAGLPSGWRRHHPADCAGDLGAASGALLVALAACLLRSRYARGDGALIATVSARDERACATLAAVSGSSGRG